MVDKRNIKNIYALSPMQEGMLMHSVYGNSPLAYFEQTRYRITGELCINDFVATWQEIVKRHDILRTMFVYENVPKPIQIVLKDRPIPIEVIDLKEQSLSDALHRVDQEELNDRKNVFHLTKDCLMRMKVFCCAEGVFEIIWSSHHILMDGWSLGIILNDFFEIYKEKVGYSFNNLKSPVSYGEYIKFLKKYDVDASLLFWKDYLQNFHVQSRVPCDFNAVEAEYISGECNFDLAPAINEKLVAITKENHLTIGSVLQALWSIVIWRLNDFRGSQLDVVFGVTVAGRPAEIDRVGEIVGLFINTVPARFKGTADETLIDFVARNHEESLQAKLHHFAPLADIQNQASLKQKLFDHIFVFENYPLGASEKTGEDIGLVIDHFKHFDFTNYDFTFQTAPADTLAFKFLYNKAKYSEDLITYLQESLLKIIALFSENKNEVLNNALVSSVPSASRLLKHANHNFKDESYAIAGVEGHFLDYVFKPLYADDRGKMCRVDLLGCKIKNQLELFAHADEARDYLQSFGLATKFKNEKNILINASFTVEPIQSSLEWWLRHFSIERSVCFAPYNQIFQQCLDPQSEFSKNTGENLILIRILDWMRDVSSESHEKILVSNAELLLESVKNRLNKNNVFLAFCPFDKESLAKEVVLFADNIIARLLVDLNNCLGVTAFDLSDDIYQFGLDTVFDAKQDELGHIPFTQDAFNCLGTICARKIISYFKPIFKVIVLDCDNTLWDGVIGESGLDGIVISEEYKKFQSFVLGKYHAGFLLAISSKNNEEDVWSVFENNPDMILKRHHIAAHRINWKDKATNIREIALELNLGLNSFLFFDDSLMECHTVMANCPEVFTVLFPSPAKNIENYLYHNWAFDQFVVTSEDLKRNEMMQSEIKRNEEKVSNSSLDNFLKGLNLKIELYQLQKDSPKEMIERASQLTMRTNQFNLNTKRRSESELLSLIESNIFEISMIHVTDRFGTYGWVGLIVLHISSNIIEVDSFLLSCRVLGRNVEHSILNRILFFAKEQQCDFIKLQFLKSQKNQPIKEFLDSIVTSDHEPKDDELSYELSSSMVIDKGLVEIHDFDPELVVSAASEVKSPIRSSSHGDALHKTTLVSFVDFSFDLPRNLQSEVYYTPLFYPSASKLKELGFEEILDRNVRTKYVPASNEVETLLVKLWEQVLSIKKIGVLDNFFELGGHSLLATRLLSLIFNQFKNEISLKDFYANASISKLLPLLQSGPQQNEIIEKLGKADFYPVSYSQKRLWALQNLDENSFAYNTPSNYLINGFFDIRAFEKAIECLVQKHEALRTNFVVIDNKPFQKILDVPLNCFEYREDFVGDVDEYLKIEGEKPFNLEKDSLLRVKVLKLNLDKHLLHINMHHIISDGWSMEVIEKDVLSFYQIFLTNKDYVLNEQDLPQYQFRDFANWHNQIVNSADHKQDLKQYWLEKLSGELGKLSLPYDRERPVLQSHRGHILNRVLPSTFYQSLEGFCKEIKCSKFVVLNALVKLLLFRYSGQKDVIVGVPVSGRNKKEFHDMIGFFVNTIALRDRVESDENLREFVGRVNQTFTDGYDHQFYPFDLLVEDLGLERDFSRSPIFDVFMSYLKFDQADEWTKVLSIENYEVDVEISRFDLMFHFVEKNEQIILDLTYNIDLFDQSTIEKLFVHFEQLSRNLLEQSDAPIKNASLLDSSEKKLLFDIGNLETYKLTDKNKQSIPDFFAEACNRYPEKIALSEGRFDLSYSSLSKLSDNLAVYLIQLGLAKGDVVACVMPKSRYSVIAMLAIFKAGGVYLPIDSKLPEQRVKYFLEDSCSKIIFVINELFYALDEGLTSINLVEVLDELNQPLPFTLPMVHVDDAAYLIYTSGSTGTPKGVLLKHAGFVNMCKQQIATFSVTSADTVLWFASPSFDASMSEIFMSLFSGGNLLVPRASDISDTGKFEELLKDKKVSVITLPPIYLHQLNFDSFENVKTLITAGEAPILSDVEKLISKCSYFNAYGPTEGSVCATIQKVEKIASAEVQIPVGKAIGGIGVMLLDADLQLCPLGHSGQIALCGVGLADSYINKKEITNDKFRILPWFADRVYLTGDLGHWNNSGELVFEGRLDSQVKFRGYRIELNEINIAIQRLKLVQEVETLVLLKNGSSELVSFLLGNKEVEVGAIRKSLSDILPSYMIPQKFVLLDQFPLTNNGKVDKVKLCKHTAGSHAIEGVSLPDNETQQNLLNEIKKVLKSDEVGIDDNIFDLGADSIRIIEFVSRLRKSGYQLKTQQVFKNLTVRDLSEVVVFQKIEKTAMKPKYVGKQLLSPIQKWYFETFSSYSHHFNHSEIYVSKKKLHDEFLIETILNLANAHEILRSRVVNDTLEIVDSVGNIFKKISVKNKDDLELKIKNEQESISSFDGPLWKVCLFQGCGEDRLLFSFHHLVIDGVSWRLIIDDFFQIYSEIEQGLLVKRAYQGFHEWTEKIHLYSQTDELHRELDYWNQFAGDKSLDFPGEELEGQMCHEDIMAVKIGFDEKETERILKQLLASLDCNINELLLSSLAWSLGDAKDCKDTMIMMEGHGRDERLGGSLSLSEIVGWFTNAFPFKLTYAKGSFLEQIASIKKAYSSLPNEGVGYSVLKYITPEYLPDIKLREFKPRISFNFLGQYDGFGENDYLVEDFSLNDYSVGEKTPLLYCLNINGIIHRNKLELYFSYHNKIYDRRFVAKIASSFKENLLSLFSSLSLK